MKVCKIEGCESEVEALDLCQRHYFRLRRTGSTELKDKRPLLDQLYDLFGVGGASESDIEQAFRGRYTVFEDCWVIGDPNRKRYPMAKSSQGPKTLHRQIAILVHGPLKYDVVRHSCDRPACIRPSHLIDGTHAENVRDREDRKRGLRPYQQKDEQTA